MNMIATDTDSLRLPGETASIRARAGAATVVAGALFLAIWLFSLSRSLFDPIGYDQAMYQYMAERIIAGQTLYVDVWDQNGPGIIAIHWVSTHLVGSSPLALRVFDALWQGCTLVALIGLAVRDGRRWATGWLAAAFYSLAYYSMGYVQTAQREGFAVLPMLLSIHLIAGNRRGVTRFLAAGALGLFIFSIKPPLGLAFGAIWIYILIRDWHSRRDGIRAFLPTCFLTGGFILAAAGAVGLLAHLGSWDGCWGILSRRDMPGYILGPKLIRDFVPILAAGLVLFVAIWLLGCKLRPQQYSYGCWTRSAAAGLVFFALLLSIRQWAGWQHVILCFIGLWIPAMGGMFTSAWQGRSEIWRLAMLLLAAATASLILQGQFFLYHLPPMLAMAAYLSAVEITDRMSELRSPHPARSAWPAVCVGCLVCLALGQWWPTMAFVTPHPYVLAGTNLSDHYTSITKHKTSCPTYATTVKVTRRIRELTRDHEPIASLFHEARIYYFAQRPPVYKLITMQSAYQHLFADYMQAIRDRRPKVITARIPEQLRQLRDLPAIQSAVFDETEAFFGPPGRTIRELYHATELIDDVCLLEPR